MVESKKSKIAKFDPSDPELLRQLDQDTLIGMYLQIRGQYSQLAEQVRQYMREKYGPKNDKFIDSNQLTLFDRLQQSDQGESVSGETTGQDPKPPRDGTPRIPKPNNLPHTTITINQRSPGDLICICCGKPLCVVGQIIHHSRFSYKPASVSMQDFVEDIYACEDCNPNVVSAANLTESLTQQEPGESTDAVEAALATELMKWIKTGTTVSAEPQDTNEQVIDDAVAIGRAAMLRSVGQIARCKASSGMLSYVAVSKYCDHLPLYRLEQIFARQGAPISRSTMYGWLAILAALLRPIYELMQLKILESNVIWTDDTPVKVLVRKLKKNIKTGRIWVYIGDEHSPFNLFDYTPGRAREGPRKFLRGFKRFLQGDCFSGNEAICAETGATLVACNAHGRRYFVKATLNYKAKSEEALRFFQELFEIEKAAKELKLSHEQIKLMREQESKPIIDKFKAWLDAEHLIALPKSAFGKAVAYCLNNWDALTAYLLSGDLTIDNNCAEREMKTVAIGRKCWMFFGSDAGGETAEVLMSIISTCKRHKVEPWAYLRDVIDILVRNPDTNLEQLLPHTWNSRATKVEIAA